MRAVKYMSIDVLEKMERPEYKVKQNRLIKEIIEQTSHATNEATVASKFELLLHDHLKEEFDTVIDIVKEITAKDGITSREFKGRMDGIVSNLVIEYKRPAKLATDEDIDSATNQLKQYLKQLKSEGLVFEGFLTDGSHYVKVYYSGDELITESVRPLDVAGLNFLILEFLNLNKKQLVSKNLQNDFGAGSVLERLQKILFNQLNDNFDGKPQMLFEEWMDIFHLSLNDDGKSSTLRERRDALSSAIGAVLKEPIQEYKALFSMQTAYAVVLKVFALKMLPQMKFNEDIRVFDDLLMLSPNQLQKIFKQIEDGYVFRMANVDNLLEGDFYSWYADDKIWTTEVASELRNVIMTVSTYADASLSYTSSSTDLFKDLYMIAIPESVRKAFGEVFTPDWLADQVVRKSISKVSPKKNWTFLDPTAGSGTFLIRAISVIVADGLKAGKSNSEILTNVLTRVTGVDLNPLSVLAGRVGYLLAIRPFMDGRSIEIPFYLGDSARLPQKETIDGVKYVKYDIDTQKANIDVIFPMEFVLSQNFLRDVYQWQTYIDLENAELLYEEIRSKFNEKINESIEVDLKKLSQTLVTLKRQNWDGIWLKILSSFLLTTRIINVDIIAGNPPWVKWENLPKRYAEKIKDIAGKRNLFSGKNRGLGGGINLNLAALISNVTAFQWLSSKGILGFLMPDTLLNSDSYEGWRHLEDGVGNRLYLDEIDDWTNAGHPFTPVLEKFLTYYIRKDEVADPRLLKYNKNFPAKTTILDVNANKSWSQAKGFYSIEEGLVTKLSKSSNRYSRIFGKGITEIEEFKLLYGVSQYKARQGVELTPKEVFLFDKLHDGLFSNVQVKATKIKPVHYEKVEIEPAIMHPLLQSKNVQPFMVMKKFDYGLIPYDENLVIFSEKYLAMNYPMALRYLANQKQYIEQQSERSKQMARGNEFYALSKIGPYSKFDYAVVFRDNTTMKAAYVDNTEYDVRLFPVKHAPFISQDINGRNITSDEAKYLTGILNLPIVKDYFKFTYSDRSFSINFDIEIPLYNKENEYQSGMVKIVNKILEMVKKDEGATFEDELNQIQNLYLEFLRGQ